MGSLVQNAGYLLELTAPTLEAAIVAVKIQYLGSLVVPITYCHFMFSYCFEKAPVKLLKVIQVIDIFILGLVFTCDLHTIFYRSIDWLQTEQGHSYLHLEYGPGYLLFMVFGTIIPYSLTLYALIRVCLKKPDYAADRKYKLILGLSFLPVVVLCAYVLKLVSVFDPTPFVLGIILSSVVILIWRRKVYDFSSLASGILLDNMNDGVIAIDKHNRIVSYNPAAAKIFRDLGPHTVGKHIEELEGIPKDILDDDSLEEFSLNDCFYQGHVQRYRINTVKKKVCHSDSGCDKDKKLY